MKKFSPSLEGVGCALAFADDALASFKPCKRKKRKIQRKQDNEEENDLLHFIKSQMSLGVVRNFRIFFKSVFPTKRGEGVLAKYELEKSLIGIPKYVHTL